MGFESTSRKKAHSRRLAWGMAFSAMLLVAGALAPVGPRASGAARLLHAAAEHEAPELPPEWRWAPKAVAFDHMFRQLR